MALSEASSRLVENAEEPEVTYENLIDEVKRIVLSDTRHVKDIIVEDEDLSKFPKPSLTSSDRAERIVARRLRTKNAFDNLLRLEEKREKKELGFEDTEDEDEQYDDENVVEHQIEETILRLMNLMEDGKDLISNVKIAAVSYEDKRRSVDRERRSKRRKILEEKAEKAKQDFMAISNKWAQIKDLSDPLDIHSATEDQKENCLRVLAKKDDIIRDLKEDLEQADIHYVRDLAQQEEDINILIERINQQINIMRAAIRTELQLLEEAIAEEREDIMKAHEIEWEELVQKKKDLDAETHRKRMEMYKKHQIEIDFLDSDLRRILSEKRSEQMITLQKEQLSLQKMRASCLFNHDKFKFNSKLLQKRRRENIIVKANCRRIVMKLQYFVFVMKRKIMNTNKILKRDLAATHRELKAIYNGIQNVEAKGATRAKANCLTFFNLWKTNESEARQLHDYIKEKRRILCEEFFNIPAPCEHDWPRISELSSYKAAVERKTIEKKGKVEPWDLVGALSSWSSERKALQSVLKHVAEYAEFLVEEHVRKNAEELLKDPKDRVVTTLDNLLTIIGVRSPSKIKQMLKHFIPILQCNTCDRNRTEATEEETQIAISDGELCPTCKGSENVQEKESKDNKTENAVILLGETVKERSEVISKVMQIEYHHTKCTCKRMAPKHKDGKDHPSSDKSVVPYKLKPCLIDDSSSTIVPMNIEKIDECLQQCHEISMERTLLLKALVNLSKEIHKERIMGVKKSAKGAAAIRDQWWTLGGSIDAMDVAAFWRALDMPPSAVAIWDYYLDILYKYQQALAERSRLNDEIKKVRKVNSDLDKLLKCSILSRADEKVSFSELPDIYKYLPEIEELCTE